HQRRFHGFDEKIVAMYARGMSVRDIQAHLRELYGVEVGHDLISRVTDAVLDDVREWQARPLEDVYPILFLDALIVKVRDGGAVRNKACYVAIGVNLEGERDVLGLWFQSSEGAKFWLAVLNELKQRGVRARHLRGRLGRALPDDRQDLARDLGARHPLPRIPHRRTPRRLHHQHDRSVAPTDPQDDQNPRTLPNRGGRPQTDLPLDHQRAE